MADSENKRGDQEYTEVIGDKIGVDGVLQDVKVSNNSMGDIAGNQENQCATVEDKETSDNRDTIMVDSTMIDPKNQENQRITVQDREDSDDRTTVVVDPAIVDPIDGVFADVLVHFFDLLLPFSNSLPGVIATYLR